MTPGIPPALRAALPVLVVGAFLITCVGVCVGFPCFTTGVRYGMWVDRCPATDMRLDLGARVEGALRGADDGVLYVMPTARFLSERGAFAYDLRGTLRRGYSLEATLTTSDGEPVDGLELGRLERSADWGVADLTLPDLPDDDYLLHVVVSAPFDTAELDLALPLFAPALVHAMSDRPLYKPGQAVLLRSVALDRRDRAPIADRPGRWQVTDPNGAVVLDERVRADSWGVADTSVPLDRRAPQGTWHVVYITGEDRAEGTFDVRPFQLPRMTATATPSQSWYRIGDELVLRGRAAYTSGAPVQRAPVTVSMARSEGRWPMPLDWEEPRTARTASDGTFEVRWGTVPADLMDRTTLVARASVTDASGERVSGGASLVLSPQDLLIDAVTDFGDGLVGNVNNRGYLRVATPDGAPLRGAEVVVKNPWDPLDKGKTATTDADGVAAIQLDPGEPVTVVHPAPPLRVRPFLPDAPRVSKAVDGTGASLGLGDRRALDALFPAVADCGTYAVGNVDVQLGVQLRANGTVKRVVHGDGRVQTCVGRAMRRARFPRAEAARVIEIAWTVPDSRQPFLEMIHRTSWGSQGGVKPLLDDASLKARACFTRGEGRDGARALTVQWYVGAGETDLELDLQRGSDTGWTARVRSCVVRAFSDLELDAPSEREALGQSVATLRIPRPPGEEVPQARTETAYQLEVAATMEGASKGTGRLVLPTGQLPPLRMRATPALAMPGDEVLVELLRGPQYERDLPEEVRLMHGSVELDEQALDGNEVRFTIPEDARGFLHVEHSGARVVIFAQEPTPLSVDVSTDKTAYRPGSTAMLTVHTTAGGEGRPAAVGLVGVDDALSQLAPLVGPDDLGSVTVRATADRPAFGVFEPPALVLGQISGENAAKAALLRVASLPMDAAGDVRIGAEGSHRADTETELLTAFYRLLEATVARVRAWERTAPEEELLDPERLVEMFDAARDALADAGTPVVDGFGRELAVEMLPMDLLAQLEPQQVVSDATRLPEDLVSLERFVREEVAQ